MINQSIAEFRLVGEATLLKVFVRSLLLKSGEWKTIPIDHCLRLVNVKGLLYLVKVIILSKKSIVYSGFVHGLVRVYCGQES